MAFSLFFFVQMDQTSLRELRSKIRLGLQAAARSKDEKDWEKMGKFLDFVPFPKTIGEVDLIGRIIRELPRVNPGAKAVVLDFMFDARRDITQVFADLVKKGAFLDSQEIQELKDMENILENSYLFVREDIQGELEQVRDLLFINFSN